MELQIERPMQDALVVSVSGRFDAHVTEQVKASWVNDEARYIFLDLSQTAFIDSLALATLMSGVKTARQRGGDFAIINPATVVRVIFEMTKLDSVLPTFATANDAYAALAADSKRVQILQLPVRLQAANAMDVRSQISRAVDEGAKTIIVDASRTEFIDSSGLAALVSGHKTMNGLSGSFVLAGVQGGAKEIFDLTRLDQVFTMVTTLDEAKRLTGGA